MELLGFEVLDTNPIIRATEHERIMELNSLHITDSNANEHFDEIVEIAASSCDAPMAIISFIDEKRQWFKAKKGLDLLEIPRELSICNYTIMEDSFFIIEDIKSDERFQKYPLLIERVNTVFYAGYPIKTSRGYNIGTISIFDTKKRTLSEKQRKTIESLSQIIVRELEHKKNSDNLISTQEKLAQTENMLLEAEKLARVGFWEYSITTHEFFCTEYVLNLLRVPREARVSNYFSMETYIIEEDRKIFRKNWESSKNTNTEIEQITRLSLSSEIVWIKIRLKSTNINENNIKISGTIQDITNEKKYEDLLIEERQKAEIANRIKSEFISIMAYEIKAPLTQLVDRTHKLLHSSSKKSNVIRPIYHSLQSLQNLINDIIDYSRIETGKIEIEKNNFSIKNLLNNAQSSFRSKASEKKLAFELYIDSDIPDQVYGDSTRLSQMLFNLVNTAIDFTKEGQTKLFANMIYRSDREWVIEFIVTYTGIGITKNQQDFIFGQLGSDQDFSHRRSNNTGLGLVITKKLAELQKGVFTFNNNEINNSTSFVLRLRYEIQQISY